MSREIDEKVVSMQFDNANFEKNVKVSMSTIEKLKTALVFKGVSEGFDKITGAAKKVTLDPMVKSVETVSLKFDALYTIANTALTNITNSAVNAGKQMVKSLSLDQITAGFSKYESMTGNVQTLVNSTGKSVDEINGYLNELMWYSDETSYGFTDMTQALATMTSSGGDIEKLVPMIEGVANATAFAGKGAAEFSRIMQYSINQAYSLGHMQLQDWKSIEGATVGSKQLKETLISAAEQLGKIEKGEITLSTFRETLKEGWLDKEVMEEGFAAFSKLTQAAYKAVQSGQFETATEAIEALAKDYDELAVRAFKSAQEAKSFTEAIDATKDAVSSGWMNTFQLIFGNYTEATRLWTDVTNNLWDIFASGIKNRNDLLTEVFTPWTGIKNQIQGSGLAVEDFEDAVKNAAKNSKYDIDSIIEKEGSLQAAFENGVLPVDLLRKAFDSMGSKGTEITEDLTGKLEDFQKVVDQVWQGSFGNGQERIEKLTAAGYDYAKVQELVDKTVDGHRLTLEELGVEQLKSIGYTDEQIAALEKLKNQANDTNSDLYTLIENMSRPSGKTLLAESLNNTLSGISTSLQAIKTAFSESFPSDKAEILYNILTRIHDFTQKLVIDIENEDGTYTETFQKLVRTFKTISSAAKIVSKVIRTAFTTAIKIVNRLLGKTEDSEKSILDTTASFGDWMTKLADWIDESQVIEKFFNTIYDLFDKFMNKFDKVKTDVLESSAWQTFTGWLAKGKNAIKDFVENFQGLSSIQNWLNNLKFDTSKITGPLSLLKDPLVAIFGKEGESEISFTYFKENLVKLTDDISGILKTFKDDFNSANEKVEEFKNNTDDSLEVVSDKTTVLGSVISDLKNKLTDFYSKVKTAFSQTGTIFNDITEWIKDNQGGILVVGFGISLIATLIVVANAFTKITAAVNKLLGPIGSMTELVKAFTNSLNAASTVMKQKAKTANLVAFGKTVATIAGAIVAVLASVMIVAKMAENGSANFDKALEVLGFVVLAIGALMLVASAAVKGMGSGAKIEASIKGMASIATAIGALAASVILMAKQASKDLTAFKTAAVVMVGLATILGGMLYAVTGANALIKSSPKFMNVAGTLIKIAEALAILAISCTLMALVDEEKLNNATLIMGILSVLLISMVGVIYIITDKLGKNVDKFMAVSGTVIAMAVAMAVLAVSLIPIAIIPQKKIWNAVGVIAVLGFVVAAMVALAIVASKIGGTLSGAGTVIAMAASVLIMAIAVKKIADIPENDLIKAMAVVAGLYLFMIGFMVLSEYAGTDVKSVGVLFLGLGAAMISIAYAMKIISKLSAGEIAKGIATVTALITLMSGFMVLSRFAGKEGGGSAALTLIGLGAALIAISGALFIISKIEPDRLLASVEAIGAIMVLLALDLVAAKNLGSEKALATLIGLTVCIALIATAMAILAKITDPQALLSTSASLSLVLLSVAGAIWIIGKSKFDAKILATLGVMMAAVVTIGAVFVLMDKFGAENALQNALAISLVLTVMVAACVLLQLANGVMPLAYAALGVMTACVASIAGILWLMTILKIENALENAAALSLLVLSLSVACVFLGAVGAIGPAAFIGLGVLGALIVALGATMAGLAALNNEEGNLKKLLEEGLPLLIMIGDAIGKFFGKMVGGFLEAVSAGIMTALIGVAAGLVTFGASMSIFGTLISGIDPSVWDGVKSMAEAILILTAADMLDGIRNFFGGDQVPPLVKFAQQLAEAAPHLADYSKTLVEGKFNGAVVAASGFAIEMLAKAAKTLPREGGLWQKIAGTAKSMGEFADELTLMAPALVSYSDCLEQNPIDTEAIQASADAIKALADVAKEMPKDGGILQDVIGHTQTLASFTAQLVGNNYGGKGVADYLVEYSNFLVSNPINSKAISGSADSIKAMVDVANAIGATGGIWQTVVGDKTSLKDFMAMFAGTDGVGAHLKDFANKMGVTDLESATAGATVLNTLVGIFNGMEATGGIFALFSGDDNNQFKKFHQDLPALGTDLNTFSTNLGKFSPTFTGYATTFLTDLFNIKNVTSENIANLGDLGESLISLADGLIDISDASSGANLDYLIESLENIISVIDMTLANASTSFKTAGGTIISNISQGMNGKSSTITNKMGNLLKAVKDKITNYLANYYAQGKNIATKVGAGIIDTTNLKTVNTDVDTFVTKIRDRLCNKANVDKMKDAGKNCVLGFAEGFKDNDANNAVVDAVTKMAQKPGQITASLNQIMSPSHLFNSMARFCVLGFAGGFEENAYLVDKPVEDMSNSAVNVLQSAISKIHELLTSGFDSDPTIRPVMDLSNVEDGIGTLKNLSRGIYGLGGSNTMAFDVSNRLNQNRKDSFAEKASALKAQNNTQTTNNTFYITGNNPDEIAEKVSRKIQRDIERKNSVWA